jgi:hypothetical protein
MNALTLALRDTRCYDDGYDYLDDWIDLTTARVTAARVTRESTGLHDAGAYTVEVRVPARAGLDPRDIMQAIRDTLGGTACRHEHDGCGCIARYASARRVGRNRYFAHVSLSRNY